MQTTLTLLLVVIVALCGSVCAEEAKSLKEVDPELWQQFQNLHQQDQEAWYRDRALSERIGGALRQGKVTYALEELALWSAEKLATEGDKQSPRPHIKEMHLRNLGAVSKAYFLLKSGKITEVPPHVPDTVDGNESFTQGYYEGLFDALIGHHRLIDGVGLEDFFAGRSAGRSVAADALIASETNKPNKTQQGKPR